MGRRSFTRLTLTALFAALTAAGTFISIPLPFTPVPIVLQNLFALLAGLILGPVLGGAAVGLYLLAGALGAPVFAGASGGFARFLGPSGGYLFGYLLGAVIAGLVAGRPRPGQKPSLWRIIPAAIAGLLAVYIPGLIQLKLVSGLDWGMVLASGFLPFLLGDGIKAVIAVLTASRLRRAAADHLES